LITKLTLADVGRFDRTRPLTVELGARVVAITGPNGAGKSTLVAALAYLLSGDSAAVDGAQSAALASGDQARPEATVWLEPAADGDPATLYRTLPGPDPNRRAKRRLEYRKHVYTADRDIAAELERWFGMPPRAFVGHAVVRQGELARIVDDDPAVRKKAIGKLLGLDHAEKVWDALGKESRLVDVPAGDLGADLEARVTALASERLAASDALAALPAAPSPGELAAAESELTRLEQAQATKVQRERLRQEEQAGLDDAGRCLSECDRLREVLARTAGAPERLTAIQLALPGERERVRLEAELARLRGLYPTSLPPDPGPAPEVDPVLAEARAQAGVWEQVARLKPGGSCPTCKRAIEGEFAALVEQSRLKLDAYYQLEREWDKLVAGYRQAVAAREVVLYQRKTLEEQAAAAKASLARLPAPAGRPLAELEAEFAAASRAAQEFTAATGELARRDAALAAARARVDAARRAAASLPAAPDDAAVVAARTRRDGLRGLVTERERAASRLAELDRRLSAETAARDRERARAAAVAPARAHAERSARLREAFHRDAAPAALVEQYLKEQEAGINQALERLGAPYRVAVTAECGFQAHFADGSPPVAHARLSGGEKLVLAWAYVMARAERHGEELWLTCLDEPTYGLDAVRAGALRQAVDAWRASGAGRQLILVTHDPHLAGVADRVIELGN
jgi:DNA repair exonuclease SbcCD ATPase subunit